MPPDSSSSETGKDTPPESSVVHFTVGEGPEEPVKPISKDKSSIARSYSQDINMLLAIEDKTTSSFLSKTSYSENSLDSPIQERAGHQKAVSSTAMNTTGTATVSTSTAMTSSQKKTLKELPPVMSVDEETLSTDSNSTTDNDEMKRRRRKILFPAFRKNKAKVT